jgi:hypothetical protein
MKETHCIFASVLCHWLCAVRFVDMSGVDDHQGQSGRQNSKDCICKTELKFTFHLLVACFMVVRVLAVPQHVPL